MTTVPEDAPLNTITWSPCPATPVVLVVLRLIVLIPAPIIFIGNLETLRVYSPCIALGILDYLYKYYFFIFLTRTQTTR